MHDLQVAVHSHRREKENTRSPVGCKEEEKDAAEDVPVNPVLAPAVVVGSEWQAEEHHRVGYSQVRQVDGVGLPALHVEGKHAQGQNVP